MKPRSNRTPWLILSILLIAPACRQNGVKDVDGNRYRTVVIGEQNWMTEDLRTTRLRDGSPIANVEDYEEWAALETPAYCWYNNDSGGSSKFGALYNGYVVETDQLCPEGWHVPTDIDWYVLDQYLGIRHMFAGALKEKGTGHWKAPNDGGTDLTGFSALPGGYRHMNGTFNLRRAEAYWWSSTDAGDYQAAPSDSGMMICRSLTFNTDVMYRNFAAMTNGFSVRCVMD